MNTIALILIILWILIGLFWSIHIPVNILHFFYGNSKPLNMWLGFLFYFSKESINIRRNKKEIEILKNGTPEQKIKIHNKRTPDYQWLTDKEVYDKYNFLNKSNIEIVYTPTFVFNKDEDRIVSFPDSMINNSQISLDKVEDTALLKAEINNGNIIPKLGNVQCSVRTHDKINTVELNQEDQIFVFRHKTDNYRYLKKSEI